MKLQFRAGMFNIFKTPNFNPPNHTLSASSQFLPSTADGTFPSQIHAQGPRPDHQPGGAHLRDPVRLEILVLSRLDGGQRRRPGGVLACVPT
jgi:hypothetical protein